MVLFSSPFLTENKVLGFLQSEVLKATMAEEHKHEESIMEKIAEKIHGHDNSSSSDSDDEKKASSIKTKIYRLFGREKPVHKVFGGGKRTDLYL